MLRLEKRKKNKRKQEKKSQMEVFQRSGGGNSGGGVFGTSKTDEIVLGGFQGKLKAGAIIMWKKLLLSIPGGPTILEDRISNAPDVVPVKFDIIERRVILSRAKNMLSISKASGVIWARHQNNATIKKKRAAAVQNQTCYFGNE